VKLVRKRKAKAHTPKRKSNRKPKEVGEPESPISERTVERIVEAIPILEQEDWGQDSLSDTIETAWCNIGQTFVDLRGYWNSLVNGLEIMRSALGQLSYKDDPKEFVPQVLFTHAVTSYVAAVMLASSGQLSGSYAILRAMLESALYGFLVARKPNLAQIWLERHGNDAACARCRREFQIGKIWNVLEKDSKSVTTKCKNAYEHCIDWGGHPNEGAIFPSLEPMNGNAGFKLHLFNPRKSFRKATFCAALKTAECIMMLFGLVFAKEMKNANLDIKIENFAKEISTLSGDVLMSLSDSSI